MDSVPEVQDFYSYGDNIDNYDRAELVLVHLARDYFLIPNQSALEYIEYVDSKLRVSEFTALGKLLSNFKKQLENDEKINLKKLYETMSLEDIEYLGW